MWNSFRSVSCDGAKSQRMSQSKRRGLYSVVHVLLGRPTNGPYEVFYEGHVNFRVISSGFLLFLKYAPLWPVRTMIFFKMTQINNLTHSVDILGLR